MSQNQIIYIDNGGNKIKADILLECPFCGSDPLILFIGNDYTKTRKVTIKCRKCNVSRTDAAFQCNHAWVLRASIKQWNKRI